MSSTEHDRRARRAYALLNCFELWIALASVIAALTFYLDPTALADSALGRAAGGAAFVWNAGYLAGAVALVYGIVRVRPRIEVVGCALAGSAALSNAVAIIALRGAQGASSVATYVGFSIAAGVRAYALVALGVRLEQEQHEREGRWER